MARRALLLARAPARACAARDELQPGLRRPPGELAQLLALAKGREAIVELGTGTAWSAIALALDDSARRIVSYDPSVRVERDAYLNLAGRRGTRAHRAARRARHPRAARRRPACQLSFIDSEHEREPVLAAFRAWRDALAPGAVVLVSRLPPPRLPGRARGRRRAGAFRGRAWRRVRVARAVRRERRESVG